MTFWILVAVAAVGLVLSGIAPAERATWWLEVIPVIIAVPLLWLTRERFPLTPLVYSLICRARRDPDARRPLHLRAGAARLLGAGPVRSRPQSLRPPRVTSRRDSCPRSSRARSSCAARRSKRGGWLFFIVVCICLAISACYEFIEWWAALIGGGSAEAFLGTQGDVWDTQWDMFLATIGAITSLLLLSRASRPRLASPRPLRQAVARPIPARRVLHPDVIGGRDRVRVVERGERDVDRPWRILMTVSQLRTATLTKGANDLR